VKRNGTLSTKEDQFCFPAFFTPFRDDNVALGFELRDLLFPAERVARELLLRSVWRKLNQEPYELSPKAAGCNPWPEILPFCWRMSRLFGCPSR
jgi:hypothetical protein